MLLTGLPEDGLARTDGCATPSEPLTSPFPSSTARICGTVAGWRTMRPPGSEPEDGGLEGAPAEVGAVRGAIVTPSSSSSAGEKAASASKESRST